MILTVISNAFIRTLPWAPLSVYERTRNELDEDSRTKKHKYFETALENPLPEPGVSEMRGY